MTTTTYRMKGYLTVSRGLKVTLHGDERADLKKVVEDIAEIKAVKAYKALGLAVEQNEDGQQWEVLDYVKWAWLLPG